MQSKRAVVRPCVLTVSLAGLLALAGCGASTNMTPATPTFTPAAGTFTAAQTVTISDSTEGATLHCTTDGTAPTASSPVCSQPTTVSKSLTLSAIATYPGGNSSAVATAAYTINLPAAATPVISPAAGTYTAAQTITLSDTTAGASIYYTADGSTPTASSSLYSGAITVSASETITAIAIAPGYADSNLATAAFSITLPAPAPVITPAGGTFTGTQPVTLTDPIAGATFYYTITPAGQTPVTPTAASTAYSGPFMVSASSTVSAVAIAPGYSLSPATTASFDLVTPTPVISPAGGSFTSLQNVTLTDATPGAAIFYTVTPTGGMPTQPTTSSMQYTGPISVSSSETIEAIALATGLDPSGTATASFTVSLPPAAAPAISPAGGTFNSAPTVTLTDATAAAVIYYTVDGSIPSAIPGAIHGMLYTGPFSVGASETVQAVATAYGYSPSAVVSAAYVLNLPAAATPVISPAGGTFQVASAPTVSIADTTPGATIYYTVDGSAPSTTNGMIYSAPFLVSQSETVKAIAVATGYANSPAASQTYTINLPTVATPVFSEAAGTYTGAQSITLSDATAGAAIFYTIDGSVPSATITGGVPTGTNGLMYMGTPITVSSTGTVKAIAVASGYQNSAVASAVYTISLNTVPTPVISPAGGSFTTPQQVTITDSNSLAAIYYTVDGSTPSATHGTSYPAQPITVGATETLKAVAVLSGFSNSAAASASFTFVAAPPTFSPNGGTFSTSDTVTINDASPGTTIYYTTDGSTPSTASTKYTAPFTITQTETITAYAVAIGYTASAPASATFTQQTVVVPTITGTVLGGASPVIGATVQLYAAGTGGYGVGATAVGSPAISGSDGSFSLQYTCAAAPGDLMYVVATGGNTTGSGATNTGLGLMAALGSCSPSLPTFPITVNEVTTIASVYALSGFASMASGGGITVGAPAPSVTCASTAVGNSQCNYPGLVNAFATVNNLVSLDGGTALSSTPAYPTSSQLPYLNTSTAPQARVNTLADILSTCVDDAGGCAALFGDVMPGTTPVDTLQATLAIARNPGYNVTTLYGLMPSTPPYTPTLATTSTYGSGTTMAPVDFTLALTFTGGGLGVDPENDPQDTLTNNALALDTAGNVWVTAYDSNPGGHPNIPGCPDAVQTTSSCVSQGNFNMIAGLNNLGAPLTPATQYDPVGYLNPDPGSVPSGPYVTQYGGFPVPNAPDLLAIDPSNNLWVTIGGPGTDNLLGKITVNPSTNPPTLSQVVLPANSDGFDVTTGTYATSFAFDQQQPSNLWVATVSPQFSEFSSAGALVNTYSNPTLQPQYGQSNFTFDTSGSLWSYDRNSQSLDLYNNSLSATTENPVAAFANVSATGLAPGAGGNMYVCNSSGNALLIFNAGASLTGPVSTFNASSGCVSPVVDGDGNFWSLNQGAETVTEVNASGVLVSPSTGFTGSSSAEPPTNTTFLGGQIAIDGSGNLWLLNSANFDPITYVAGNVLVEMVGVAAPTIAPLSVATQNSAQGTRP